MMKITKWIFEFQLVGDTDEAEFNTLIRVIENLDLTGGISGKKRGEKYQIIVETVHVP